MLKIRKCQREKRNFSMVGDNFWVIFFMGIVVDSIDCVIGDLRIERILFLLQPGSLVEVNRYTSRNVKNVYLYTYLLPIYLFRVLYFTLCGVRSFPNFSSIMVS